MNELFHVWRSFIKALLWMALASPVIGIVCYALVLFELSSKIQPFVAACFLVAYFINYLPKKP